MIPADWRRRLELVQRFEPEAHIAGGALRDLFHGRPVKDVDIFIPAEYNSEIELVLREDAGMTDFEFTSWVAQFSESKEFPNLKELHVSGRPGEDPVDLIWLPDMPLKKNLDRFDFGICKIGFDGERLHYHELFDWDSLKHTFTLTRAHSLDDFHLSLRRWAQSLSQKYPGWSLVIPSRLSAKLREIAV